MYNIIQFNLISQKYGQNLPVIQKLFKYIISHTFLFIYYKLFHSNNLQNLMDLPFILNQKNHILYFRDKSIYFITSPLSKLMATILVDK